MEYKRNCPGCGIIKIYKTREGKMQAERNKSLCAKCAASSRVYTPEGMANLKRRSSEVRKGKTYTEIHGVEGGKRKAKQHSKAMTGKSRKPFTQQHRSNISKSHKNSEVFQNAMQSKEYRELRSKIAIENYCKKKGIDVSEYNSHYTSREEYYTIVNRITEKQPLHLLEHYDKRGNHAFDTNAYHVDHIIPKSYGYHNNIPPEIIGDIDNLQMLPWYENVKKRDVYDD